MEDATGQWERRALAMRAPFPGLPTLTWATRITLFSELVGVSGVVTATDSAVPSSVSLSKAAVEEGARVTADCGLRGY